MVKNHNKNKKQEPAKGLGGDNSELLNNQQALDSFKEIFSIRKFEEKALQIYGMGKIGGFCHLYIGQEAVLTGMKQAKSSGDKVITSYRNHGHAISSGIPMKNVFAELMGRIDGCSKGKGGSMHMFNPDNNYYGGHGIVGSQVSLGTGIAFAEQYNNTGNLCLTALGDGAVHQGQTHESLNMAALWNLPIIYIIENNEYAMGTSVSRSSQVKDLCDKGASHGIKGVQVDGMDINAVYEAGLKACEHVRSGKGPIILEMKTYRYKGHSVSDPANYRSKEELDSYKGERDPIASLEQYILENKFSTEDEIKELKKQLKDEVKQAYEEADKSPVPDESELYKDIYK
jgi:pyruvate dehydrogenase E1 component alpha subunit